MKQEIFQKSNLSNSKEINIIQSAQNNKNIVFYRKSSQQNKKNSFYQHKRGINSSNIMAQNKNISGTKKRIRLYNNTNNTIEDTNPTSKIKLINYSRDKSSIECTNTSLEKIDIFKANITPFCIESDKKSNENIYINKVSQNPKNKINSNNFIIYDNCKINNLTVENCRPKNKSLSNINVSYGENVDKKNFNLVNNDIDNESNNIFLNPRSKKIKNLEKKGINFTFKDNNAKDSNSNDLINMNLFANEAFDKRRNNKCRNKNINIFNENSQPNSNYITIDVDMDNSNNNKYANTSHSNNIYFNKKIIYNKNKESRYKNYKIKYKGNIINNDIKNTNYIDDVYNINTNKGNNFSKGKIIKFKYNGTEFFFHPTHNKNNKSHNNIFKKESDIVKKAK